MLFTSQGLILEVTCLLCDNPECPCTHASFEFQEIDAHARPRRGGVAFKAQIDLVRDTEPKAPGREPDDAILRDFVAQGRQDGLLASLWEERQLELARKKRLAEAVIDPQVIEKGTLVCFVDLADGRDSGLQKGRAVSFSTTFDGRDYYALDYYCPKPTCKCDHVELSFLTQADRSGEEVFTRVFDACVTPRGRVTIQTLYRPLRLDEATARQVVKSLIAEDEDFLPTLRTRRRIVKEIATRSLAAAPLVSLSASAPDASPRPAVPSRPEAALAESPVAPSLPGTSARKTPARRPRGPRGDLAPSRPATSARKVGRNDPCPCGSGKKYKKCCGA